MIEKRYAESAKLEDKAMNDYWEYYGQVVEQSELPKDWDAIYIQLESFLMKYPSEIQTYILQRQNDWIKDLPPAARQVEEMRAKGIEDESWWKDYRGATVPKAQISIPEITKPKESGRGALREYLFGKTSKTYTPYQQKSRVGDKLRKYAGIK